MDLDYYGEDFTLTAGSLEDRFELETSVPEGAVPREIIQTVREILGEL